MNYSVLIREDGHKKIFLSRINKNRQNIKMDKSLLKETLILSAIEAVSENSFEDNFIEIFNDNIKMSFPVLTNKQAILDHFELTRFIMSYVLVDYKPNSSTVSFISDIVLALEMMNKTHGKTKSNNFSQVSLGLFNQVLIDSIRLSILQNIELLNNHFQGQTLAFSIMMNETRYLFKNFMSLFYLTKEVNEKNKDSTIKGRELTTVDSDFVNNYINLVEQAVNVEKTIENIQQSTVTCEKIKNEVYDSITRPKQRVGEFKYMNRLNSSPVSDKLKELINDSFKKRNSTKFSLEITNRILLFRPAEGIGTIEKIEFLDLLYNYIDYFKVLEDKASILEEYEKLGSLIDNYVCALVDNFLEINQTRREISVPLHVVNLSLGNVPGYKIVYEIVFTIVNGLDLWRFSVMITAILFEVYFKIITDKSITVQSVDSRILSILSKKGINFPRSTDSRMLELGVNKNVFDIIKQEF